MYDLNKAQELLTHYITYLMAEVGKRSDFREVNDILTPIIDAIEALDARLKALEDKPARPPIPPDFRVRDYVWRNGVRGRIVDLYTDDTCQVVTEIDDLPITWPLSEVTKPAASLAPDSVTFVADMGLLFDHTNDITIQNVPSDVQGQLFKLRKAPYTITISKLKE